MSTKFTLRRFSKLVSKIDNRLHELHADLNASLTKDVHVHDPLDNSIARIKVTKDDFVAALDEYETLTQIRWELRRLIGAANQENGVNDLVAEMNEADAILNTVSHLYKRHGRDPHPVDTEIKARLQAAQTAGTRSELSLVSAGYGRLGSSSSQAETLTFAVLSDGVLDRLQETEKTMRDKIDQTVDRLERINSSVFLELTPELEDSLVELGLLTA